ncbi:MAG: pyruvate formate lyase-activating protein [Clostridia bacterium]|nr:pyruvate formate lyase-activating protein [Clostridia bacterium]
MILGNIDSFETMGLVDGPGVRFVVFMQGCPIRCAYCHNPEMWDPNLSKMKMTPEELIAKVLRYKPYFKNGGGLTISGGEPLMQAEFVKEVFKLCKQNGIHTCLDTSGQGDVYDELLDFCDLVILDVKELDKDRYLNLVGKDISRFNKFLEACQKKHKKMWLRQVIVPNYNDTEESVLKLKAFAKKLHNIEKIELLPYHTMAKEKYQKLGIKYRLEDTPEMDKTRCKDLEKLLQE